MKIRKAIRYAIAASVVAAPGLLQAAPTSASFGNWDLNSDGTVNASAPTGMTCSGTPNSDVGFVQRQCTDGTATYIQTIVGEGTAGAGESFSNQGAAFFGDENFVKMGSSIGGILDKQQLKEVTGGDTFTGGAELKTGEFEPTALSGAAADGSTKGQSVVWLSQSVSNTGQEFTSTFNYHDGNELGGDGGEWKILDLRQSANDTAAGFTSGFAQRELVFANTGTSQDTYGFVKRDLTSNLVVPDSPPGEGITQNFTIHEREGGGAVSAGSATNGGASFSFAAGDLLATTIIAQTVSGAGVFGLNDLADETSGTGADQDSQVSVPSPTFYTIVPDPFGAF